MIATTCAGCQELLARDMLEDDFSEKMIHALGLTDLQLR